MEEKVEAKHNHQQFWLGNQQGLHLGKINGSLFSSTEAIKLISQEAESCSDVIDHLQRIAFRIMQTNYLAHALHWHGCLVS